VVERYLATICEKSFGHQPVFPENFSGLYIRRIRQFQLQFADDRIRVLARLGSHERAAKDTAFYEAEIRELRVNSMKIHADYWPMA
jgi:hypothetical protein